MAKNNKTEIDDKVLFSVIKRCIKESRTTHNSFERVKASALNSRINHPTESVIFNASFWDCDCGKIFTNKFISLIYLALLINNFKNRSSEIRGKFISVYNDVVRNSKFNFKGLYSDPLCYKDILLEAMESCFDSKEVSKTKIDNLFLMKQAVELNLPL